MKWRPSVKSKISVTMEQSLLEFLDSLPGDSRSEKIEGAVLKIKKVAEEKDLRVQLGGYREDDVERVERELWESTIAEAMWTV
jgi:hypothetical protein